MVLNSIPKKNLKSARFIKFIINLTETLVIWNMKSRSCLKKSDYKYYIKR